MRSPDSSDRAPGTRPLRELAVAGATVAALALAITVLVAIGNPTLLSLDKGLNAWIAAFTTDQDWLLAAAAAIGKWSGPMPSVGYAVIAVVSLVLLGRWHLAALVAASGLAGVIVVEVIKVSMARSRPPGAADYVTDLEKSFPSGHAAAGIYVYVCLGIVLLLLARGSHHRALTAPGLVLLVLGPLIGASRLVLGVHWLSDVVAGWLYGSAVLMAALVLARWLQFREQSPGTRAGTSATPRPSR